MPGTLGVKVTAWWTTWSGPITRPSASGVVLVKSLLGALALVTVTGTLPVLVMSKLAVAELPTATLPKERVGGLNVRWPAPAVAVPVIGMVSVPEVLVTVIEELSVPAAVGV